MSTIKQFFLLLRIMFKGEVVDTGGTNKGLSNRIKNKVLSQVVKYGSLLLLIAYLGVFAFFTAKDIADPELIISAALRTSVLFSLVFGLLYAVSVLFYSKDISFYLTLPVKQGVLVAVKQFQVYYYVLGVLGLIWGVMTIMAGILHGCSASFFIRGIISVLIGPVCSIAVICIVIILLVYFTRFAANKDSFQKAMGGVMLAFMLFIIFAMQSRQNYSNNPSFEGAIAAASQSSWLQTVSYIFSPISFLMEKTLGGASSWTQFFYTLASVLVSFVYCGLLYLVASKFYLPAVLKLQGTDNRGNSALKRSPADRAKAGTGKGQVVALSSHDLKVDTPFKTLVGKEFKLLNRVPTFFTTYLLSSLTVPLIALASGLFGFFNAARQSGEAFDLMDMIGTIRLGVSGITADPDLHRAVLSFGLMAVFGAVGFLGATSMQMSSSSISREGQDFYLMKVLPVPYTTQLAAKLVPALTFNLLSWIIIFVPLAIIFAVPWSLAILLIYIVVVGVVTNQFIGLYMDIKLYRLDWESEAELARRQNVVWLGLLIGLTIAGIEIGSVYLVNRFVDASLTAYYLLGFGLPLLPLLLILVIYFTNGLKSFARIEV